MTEHHAHVEETACATDESSAKVKSELAKHHLMSADYFASQALSLERTEHQPDEKVRMKHRAYVMGAAFSATAFLEARINEIFISASEVSSYSEFGFDSKKAAALALIWPRAEKEWWSIANKYQNALQGIGQPEYDKDHPLFKEIISLVSLRNALTHYKPEWDDSLRQHAGLAKVLEGKFTESPFSDKRQSFFPHRCLGAGCANWSVHVAREFALDFYSRLASKKPSQ